MASYADACIVTLLDGGNKESMCVYIYMFSSPSLRDIYIWINIGSFWPVVASSCTCKVPGTSKYTFIDGYLLNEIVDIHNGVSNIIYM